MFNDVNLDGVEKQEDRLGGGSFTLPTGVYDATIKVAYVVDAAKSKSQCVVTVFDVQTDPSNPSVTQELTERNWVLNRDGGATYEKNGRKFMIPGYENVNDMCLMATGLPLKEQSSENKVIKVWDGAEGKEVEKSLPVFTSLLGKPITIAVSRIIENKEALVGERYVKTNDERTINEIEKFFHAESKRTFVEVSNGVPADTPHDKLFYGQWREKYTGKDRNNFKEQSGAAASGGGKAAAKGGSSTSLFS